MGRGDWLLQPMRAVKEQLGRPKPLLHLPGSLGGSAVGVTPVTVLSADPVRPAEWVARDRAKKGIRTQLQASLFMATEVTAWIGIIGQG